METLSKVMLFFSPLYADDLQVMAMPPMPGGMGQT